MATTQELQTTVKIFPSGVPAIHSIEKRLCPGGLTMVYYENNG